MTQNVIWQELLRAVLTLAAGAIVARFGLYLYFRQKEYETVKQRYLEQSVDLIAAEFESMARIFSHNWARSLDILKLYRELPGDAFDVAELKSGFLEPGAPNFQRVAHHRLTNLIRSNVVWDVFQLALARHKSLNAKVVTEVPLGIRLHSEGRMTNSREEFLQDSSELLKPLSDESDRFTHLLAALQVIAAELEKSSLRFKEISKFHKRKAVVEVLGKLRSEFAVDLPGAVG